MLNSKLSSKYYTFAQTQLQYHDCKSFNYHARDMNIQIKQPSSVALMSSIFGRRYDIDSHGM